MFNDTSLFLKYFFKIDLKIKKEMLNMALDERFIDNYSCGASVRLYIMSLSQEKNFSDWKNANVYWDDDLNEILPKEVDSEFYINFNVY